MAENESKGYPPFDVGIMDTQTFGNLKDAEDFLSGNPAEVITKTSDIKEIEEEDKELPKVKKLKEEHKEEIKPEKLAENFLDEGEEEEDKKEEPKVKKLNEEPKEEVEDKLNQFEVISKELYTLGVFTQDEGEEPVIPKTPEEFASKFQEEKRKGMSQWLESFLSQHGEDRRELFQAIFVDGVDPEEYLPIFSSTQSFEGVDLENEGVQENVVRTYYERAGWDRDKIDKKIQKLKDYADLEDEAKTVHPQIISQDKTRMEEIAERERNKHSAQLQMDNEYKVSVQKLLQEKIKVKEVDGLPLTDKDANQAFDFLYSKKWKTADGQLLTDFDKFILETKKPENLITRLKISLLALNNFDFSKIEKKAITKQSSSLFNELTQKNAKKTNTAKVETNSSSDW